MVPFPYPLPLSTRSVVLLLTAASMSHCPVWAVLPRYGCMRASMRFSANTLREGSRSGQGEDCGAKGVADITLTKQADI
jgi:hypothetical protein